MKILQLCSLFKAGVAATAAMLVTSSTLADEDEVLSRFQGDSPNSEFTINYGDWDSILAKTVLDTGHSDRTQAPKARPMAGSRIIRGSSSLSRLEGNRVDFHAFSGENLEVLRRLRDDLAQVPDIAPLRLFNKGEQLAYWLNLYNVTVMLQIAEIFPETNLKRHYPKLWDEKVLTVAGMRLSLNDIHHKILIPKYKNPLIMYGLFQGVIGGPNMRNEAYVGSRVWDQLEENATEFVNSNRGALVRERILRTSYFYEVNAPLFPDFNRDLRRHIRYYAKARFADKITAGSSVVGTGQSNWYIADLFGGNKAKGSANTNQGALLLAFRTGGGVGSSDGGVSLTSDITNHATNDNSDPGGYAGGAIQTAWARSLADKDMSLTRFPMHMVQYLRKIHQRKIKELREAEVDVEEVEDSE